ncbi:MAG: acyloxyacyl hydrolase [Verrucomicrobia bacterium]|nr:acyloxyacyl hydrolase [Verrucomicrobiota bacterium]
MYRLGLLTKTLSVHSICVIHFMISGMLTASEIETNSATPEVSIAQSQSNDVTLVNSNFIDATQNVMNPVDESGLKWYGPRFTAGFATVDTDEDFDFAVLGIGFEVGWPEALRGLAFGQLEFVLGLGRMQDENENTAFLISFGPAVELHPLGEWLSIDIGSRPTLISKDDLGMKPIGGPIQFISHLAARLHLDDHIELGIRVQHLSSAGFSDPNPGVDTVAVDFIYHH